MADPDKTPIDTPIPAAAGIVALAGKQPLPLLLDLNGDGILDVKQSWFWDGAAVFLVKLAIFFAPNNPYSLLIQRYEPDIKALIDKGLRP